MAARNPAPPPPTTSTSHAKTSIAFFEDQRRGSDQEVDLLSHSARDPMTPRPRQSERIINGLPILKPEISQASDGPSAAPAWRRGLPRGGHTWQPVVKRQLHSAGDASPLHPTAHSPRR